MDYFDFIKTLNLLLVKNLKFLKHFRKFIFFVNLYPLY